MAAITVTGLVLSVIAGIVTAGVPDEQFQWKELTFSWPDPIARETLIKSGEYIPENNLPLGLDRWRDKLFITVPRWKAGVASSLNYIPLGTNQTSPDLIPYPSWQDNLQPRGDELPSASHIISTFRVRVDPCDRLWVMDTALADIFGAAKRYGPPSIVIFDLNTDQLIRRYQFKETDMKEDSFFANIIVDVDKDKCDQAFAYIPDLGEYGVVVYSFAENDSWRVKHNFFHFDPLNGDFNVGGVNFQWTDGVFGLALSPADETGYRTMYFHPLASTHEFSVSTQVLRNKTIAQGVHAYSLFKIEGDKGEKSQTSASDLDEPTNVLFLTQLNRDGVACWNTKKPLNPENVALVVNDSEKLIFTNDLKIDCERNLWFLSDKMPKFLYHGLDSNEINYRIFKVPVDQLIKGTVCEP